MHADSIGDAANQGVVRHVAVRVHVPPKLLAVAEREPAALVCKEPEEA